MTTQNIHPEHSDAVESVVKHEFVSETETSPPPPAPEASATNESVSPAGTQNVPHEEHSSKPAHISQQDQTVANSATTEPDTFFAASHAPNKPEPIAESIETSLAHPLEKEEEIRPFTAYIEEFQQTETRLGSSLTEYASNSFTRLPAPGEQQEEKPASSSGSEETQPFTSGETATPELETPTPVPAARPVSPLLRPATPRTRSRHGNARQREGTPVVKEEPIQKAVEPQKTEAAQAITEPAPPAVEEQQRPARRYRFDRPAAPAATAPPPAPFIQVRAEEDK